MIDLAIVLVVVGITVAWPVPSRSVRSFMLSASRRASRPSRVRRGAARGASRVVTTLPGRPVVGPAVPYPRHVRVVDRRRVDPHYSNICPDCGHLKEPEWMLCNDCGIRLSDMLARRRPVAS